MVGGIGRNFTQLKSQKMAGWASNRTNLPVSKESVLKLAKLKLCIKKLFFKVNFL